jgi:hypothetical protein
MARYCQIARLLPPVDDFDPHDREQLADAKLVLAELASVQAELDAMSAR